MLYDGPGQPVDRRIRLATLIERVRVGDIEQHDPVHAESEEHRRRRRRGGRQRRAGEPKRAENEHERDGGRQRSDGDQPQAAEHDEEQRQNQRQRADRVRDALAPDERFGFDAMRWPPANSIGQRTALRRPRLRVRRAAQRPTRGSFVEPRGERPREVRVVRRASRLRDHQASPSVLGHVAAFGDPDVEPGLRAAELFPHQIEESERILPHQLRDFRRRHGQQCAAFGDRLPHAVAAEALQRLLEGVVAKQEQLAVGQPAEVLGRVHRAAVDARDFRRFSQARRSRRRSARRSR